jgi:hypothetical protein
VVKDVCLCSSDWEDERGKKKNKQELQKGARWRTRLMLQTKHALAYFGVLIAEGLQINL